jgi:hypothetical protein
VTRSDEFKILFTRPMAKITGTPNGFAIAGEVLFGIMGTAQ